MVSGSAQAPLCIASVLLLVAIRKYSAAFAFDLVLWSAVFHTAAFYWLPDTLQLFGGFPKVIAIVLFALYVLVSSFQFAICGWLTQRLSVVAPAFALALSWSATEYFIPRLFPWSIVHPLIGVKSFSLLAAYFGVAPLAFLLFWVATTLFEAACNPRTLAQKNSIACIAALLIGIVASHVYRRSLDLEIAAAPKVTIGVVQGNLTAIEKREVRSLSANLDRYRVLSADVVKRGAEFLIWPETVMAVWTPENVNQVRGTKYDPAPADWVPMLYGGLSFRPRAQKELEQAAAALDPETLEQFRYEKFNSAFGMDAAGKITGRYHKRVLMPFGEYLPLAQTFPSIRSFSPYSGDFTSGEIDAPITMPLADGREVHAGMLICYEDLVPHLSRSETILGANILVNLTNDAWYGPTSAPYQHHLLASWRAIETGRYLIRATNTGLTGIVSPDGETVASLPIFQEATLTENISLLEKTTFYVKAGDVFSWLLCILCVAGYIAARRRITASQS